MNYFYMILCGVLGVALYATFKAYRIQDRYANENFASLLKITFTKETAAFVFGLLMVIVGTIFLHGILQMNADGKPIPYLPAKYAELFFYQLNVFMVMWGALWSLVGLSWFGVSENIARKRAEELEKKYSGEPDKEQPK